MLHVISVLIAFCLIILIAPQTPTENIVLRKLLESGLFTNYSKAKDFLLWSTWILIFLFLLLLIFLNITF
uniref:Putative chloroplast RF47 n=1 Tax=Chlorella sorokiniana TaxID=3076 RepID=A0A076EEX9_CHLSO|nr:putative chloroplast RF47 [Chlorella sorokiniana]AKJ26118.1 putative chloroplast RF47 [Chlorella sorokiniana]